jgi:group I intron endonuclease
MYVYKIVNKVNLDFYIGKTIKDVNSRFKQHCLLSASGSDTHLHRAIRKYGQDNFQVEIIEYKTSDLLNEGEMRWISYLSPPYNMTKGGDGGDTSLSENYKRYMNVRSEMVSGELNPFYGKRHTEETKQKISLKKMGTTVSPETKEKMSKAMVGRKHQQKTIEKLKSINSKTYYLITPTGDNITVTNLTEYCFKNNLDQRNMNNMYRGLYKTSKGYKRNYIMDPISEND